MNGMNVSDKELEDAFKNVKATLAIEGLDLPESAYELYVKKLRGEISDHQFVQLVLEIVRK